MTNRDIEDKLKALRDRFRHRLQDTRKIIADWPDNTHVDELETLVHKLAGTAGTYGYHELSQQMRELEEQIRNIKDQDITDTQALNLYANACALLDQALSQSSRT